MIRGKKSSKKAFSSFGSKVGQGNAKAGPKRAKQKKPQEKAAPNRGQFSVFMPIGTQTVLAVLVCCAVFIGAGFFLIGADQKEIVSLRSDLKAYSEDGVVPATTLNDAIDLSTEALCGRLATLQGVLDSRSEENENTLTNEQMQWFGTELAAVTAESRSLNEIIASVEVDKTVTTAYTERVQVPLASIQSAYDGMQVSDTDMANTNVKEGAATDTGSFKANSAAKTRLTLIIIIVAVILVALALFVFRNKLTALLGLKGSKGRRKNRSKGQGQPENKEKTENKSKRKGLFGAKSKSKSHGDGREVSHSKDILSDINDEEKTTVNSSTDPVDNHKAEENNQKEKPKYDFEAEVLASVKAEFATEDDPLQRLAAMHKAEAAAKADADAAAIVAAKKRELNKELGVGEEELMAFDPKITSQAAIDDEEDPFFKKKGTPQ